MRGSTAFRISPATSWALPTTCTGRWRRSTTSLRAKADEATKALLEGVELTERELMNVLEKHGVKRIEPLGQKFDPNRHQAMYEIEDASVPSGSVVQVMQAGYLIGDRDAAAGAGRGGQGRRQGRSGVGQRQSHASRLRDLTAAPGRRARRGSA